MGAMATALIGHALSVRYPRRAVGMAPIYVAEFVRIPTTFPKIRILTNSATEYFLCVTATAKSL
jgi:hypothetical protein